MKGIKSIGKFLPLLLTCFAPYDGGYLDLRGCDRTLRGERPHSLGATCFAHSAFDPNAQEAIAPFRTRSVFEVIPTHDRVGLQLILNSKGALVGRGMPLP